MKILYATDGSECAENAARFLLRFRFREDDEIMILYVVTSIPFHDDYHAQVLQAVRKVGGKIVKSAEQALAPLAARISVFEREGAPDAVIEEVASASGADLVVMGARGLKGIKSYFLGSVTRSVIINGTRPVLVTKPWSSEDGKSMRVLFASDGSESSVATRQMLAQIPFPPETELSIMHVAWAGFTDIPERFAMEIDERAKEALIKVRTREIREAEKIIEGDRELLANKFSKLHALIKGGDPANEVLKEAESMKADLIALGCRGLRGLKSMMGSVSRRILDHAPCPVLLGKAMKS